MQHGPYSPQSYFDGGITLEALLMGLVGMLHPIAAASIGLRVGRAAVSGKIFSDNWLASDTQMINSTLGRGRLHCSDTDRLCATAATVAMGYKRSSSYDALAVRPTDCRC